jgi:hypothetical protein
MKSRIPTGDELTMSQILAELYTAKAAIDRALTEENRVGKYLKGLAGYHLQQATEKMIKIQIYKAGVPIDFSKMFRHNICDLVQYAEQLGISLLIPPYVKKHDIMISGWEAEGRYEVHVVVRTDTLKKAYTELTQGSDNLREKGFG